MSQALYAHMNNKRKMEKKILPESPSGLYQYQKKRYV
jgi:hypothetical protein